MGIHEINTISVIGAGAMGHGIAQVFAMNGFEVHLVDISEEILENALSRIKYSLERFVKKGKLSPDDIENVLNRIKTYVELSKGVRDSDLVIEAVSEDINLKIKIFEKVDENAPKDTIIASNTSGLPITAMAEATKRSDKVVGMHWFNPPQIMKLIEVIRCKYTSEETAELIYELSKKIGKAPILVNKDIRDFIANRVYRAIRYEAYLMFYRGEHKPVEIDSAMRYKLGSPMGAFELTDFTGAIEIELLADKSINELCTKYPDWEPHSEYLKFRQYALRVPMEYYKKGFLGVKSGRGFYKYPKPGQWSRVDIPEEAGENVDLISLISPAINLSAWLIENGVTASNEIDLAIKLGFRFKKGILEKADELGIEKVVETLLNKRERWKSEEYSNFYIPQKLLKNMAKKGLNFYD